MTTQTKPEVVQSLVTMILDVVGDSLVDIEATTSFRDDLEFHSIQFVALAELIQERWPDIDFVSWVSGKQREELLALRVGDVADFVVASAP
jgi:acyl carrier protein